MIKRDGDVVVNMKYIQPCSSGSSVKSKTIEELMQILREKANVHEVDGAGLAEKLGNMLVVNTILLARFQRFLVSRLR